MSSRPYTRDFIVERASVMASAVGLTGLSIGELAHCLRRPKSSVYFHFRSKVGLQIGVLDNAAKEFIREVIRPAFERRPGLPRLRRLFEEWLVWDRGGVYPGGCLFVATACEFDDRPGPVRDRLVRLTTGWHYLLRSLVQSAIATGELYPNTDPHQFVQDLHGIMLAYHLAARLLHDADAERRAVRSFEELLARR